MSQVIDGLRYTRSHEWASPEGDEVRVGITAHAQDQLGDIVFVQLPEVGERFEAGDAFGVVESVKAVSDLYAPISGEVVAINDALVDTPEHVNTDCYGEGWLIRLKPASDTTGDLLDADAYRAFLDAEDH